MCLTARMHEPPCRVSCTACGGLHMQVLASPGAVMCEHGRQRAALGACRDRQGICAQGMKLYAWSDFLAMGERAPAEAVAPKPDDIATIMYTSGTTGARPEGTATRSTWDMGCGTSGGWLSRGRGGRRCTGMHACGALWRPHAPSSALPSTLMLGTARP